MDAFDLWTLVRRATERALASGALEPIPTRPLFIEDAGVTFLVRVVENLRRKSRANAAAAAANPFLPYDPALFVAELSGTHLALLNKFNVVEQHALLVTREFVPQERELTLSDFEAAFIALAAGPSLVFYNSGPVAGASQPHRHLQAIPCPLAATGPEVPIESALGAPRAAGSPGGAGPLASSPELPFRHVLGWLDPELCGSPASAAAVTLELYRAALAATGLSRDGGAPARYNLLLTRGWLLLVPRTRECFGTISVNALGFAGALLVRDEAELELVRQRGPMGVLRDVTTPG